MIYNCKRQSIHIQKQITQIQQENKKLKEFIYQIEQTQLKDSQLSKIIFLTDSLNDKIKQNNQLIKINEDMKKNLKYTNINEIQIENEQLIMESRRVKEQLQKMCQYQNDNPNDLIQTLNQQIIQQNIYITKLKTKNLQFQEIQQDFEQVQIKNKRDLINLKYELKNSKFHQQDLLENSKNIFKNKILKQKDDIIKDQKDQIQELEKANFNKSQEIKLQQNEIQEFQQKLKYLKDLPHIYDDLTLKHLELRKHLQKMQENIVSRDQQIYALKLQYGENVTKQLQQLSKQQELIIKSNEQKAQQCQLSDYIIATLRFNLIQNRINFDDIDSILESTGKKFIGINALQVLLQAKPFSIIDQCDVKKLSHYIIHFDDQNIQDSNKQQNPSMISMILKKIIKRYSILTDQEQLNNMLEIARQINQNKDEIQSHLRKKQEIRGLNKKIFFVKDLFEIQQFTSLQKDKIYQIIFNESKQLQIFHLKLFFQLWYKINKDLDSKMIYINKDSKKSSTMIKQISQYDKNVSYNNNEQIINKYSQVSSQQSLDSRSDITYNFDCIKKDDTHLANNFLTQKPLAEQNISNFEDDDQDNIQSINKNDYVEFQNQKQEYENDQNNKNKELNSIQKMQNSISQQSISDNQERHQDIKVNEDNVLDKENSEFQAEISQNQSQIENLEKKNDHLFEQERLNISSAESLQNSQIQQKEQQLILQEHQRTKSFEQVENKQIINDIDEVENLRNDFQEQPKDQKNDINQQSNMEQEQKQIFQRSQSQQIIQSNRQSQLSQQNNSCDHENYKSQEKALEIDKNDQKK